MSEFQINTYTYNSQGGSAVAVLSNGGFVVTWESYYQDQSNTWGVYGKLYDAKGEAEGYEFRVNTYYQGNESDPSVTDLDGGGFVEIFAGGFGLLEFQVHFAEVQESFRVGW